MSQPIWKPVSAIGDIDPFSYGGGIVYIDTTGVYPPELVYMEPEPTEAEPLTVYRCVLDRCTFIDGILSDNEYHPNKPTWFAHKLDDLASFAGVEPQHLIDMLTSAQPEQLAAGYCAIADYFGWIELDHYPLTMSEEEARNKYAADLAAARYARRAGIVPG